MLTPPVGEAWPACASCGGGAGSVSVVTGSAASSIIFVWAAQSSSHFLFADDSRRKSDSARQLGWMSGLLALLGLDESPHAPRGQ